MNSAEEAGGTAHGISARYAMENDGLEVVKNILRATAEWVEDNAGMFLGHVKMSLDAGGNGSMTLNLTDLDTGVEEHGSMNLPANVQMKFMAAVLDVDHDELAAFMEKLLEVNGININRGNRNIIELR